MRRNLKQVILWGLAILAIPLFVLAATTSKKINSSGYTKDQGYFPIATTGIASFQDPASVGNYPATIHGYPYSSPNLADPQYERILVTDKWIPRATWTTTYITEPRIICTRGYNGTSAKECVPNKSVSIKFKTNYNTLTNTPNPTSTLTPVPPTATFTPNGTETLVLTAVVATTSPTLTYSPTFQPDNMHINNIVVGNVYNSSDLSTVVRCDSTKTMWGDPGQRNIMQGSDNTISSEGPVTIDADGGIVQWARGSSGKGPSGSHQILAQYSTPIVSNNYVIPLTQTPVAGVNDFVGSKIFGDDFKITMPEATATPLAAELVRWGFAKPYVDAGVNAVSTPAYLAYAVATHCYGLDPVATAQVAILSNMTQVIPAMTAVIDIKPIATRAYMIQAVGTPNAVPEFVGQFYLATDTNKLSIGINPTSTPDPGNWTTLN